MKINVNLIGVIMDKQQIEPGKITKPIQLLAAWLVGLILVNGSFLGAAATIVTPAWARDLLVIASIVNVPIFLVCIFLLQTRFRPEMQEDSYYSKYLEANTGKSVSVSLKESLVNELKIQLELSTQKNLSLISSVEEGVERLAAQVSLLSTNSSLSLGDKEKIEGIEKEIIKSSKAIEQAKKGAVSTETVVRINDLLPEYQAILKELNNNGVFTSDTFGSSSEDPEVPKKKIFAFGRYAYIKMVKNIWSIVKRYGFDLIQYADKPFNKGIIYIGSYVYRAAKEP